MESQRFIILRTDSVSPLVFPGPLDSRELVAELRLEAQDFTPNDVADARRDPSVRAIAPPMPVRLMEPTARSASASASGGVAWGVVAVGADQSPFTGAGVTVAVLDTGIDNGHNAFSGVTLTEKDFTGEGPGDDNGHGTHVAGTIFGRDVNGFRIGVAPGVTNALIGKVLGKTGGGDTLGICQAMLWADDQGADIISMSLGFDFPGLVDQLVRRYQYPIPLATSAALRGYQDNVRLFEAIAESLRARAVFEQGVMLISAAAGNESQRDVDPRWVIHAAPPSAADGFLSVSALGQSSGAYPYSIAPFSNTGVDLCAPGVDTISAKAGTSDGLATFSGTSMAAPHVAGVAAMWAEKIIKSSRPLTTTRLTTRLMGHSQPLAGLDPFDIGNGLVKAPN
jgi:subtilisin family serine protease